MGNALARQTLVDKFSICAGWVVNDGMHSKAALRSSEGDFANWSHTITARLARATVVQDGDLKVAFLRGLQLKFCGTLKVLCPEISTAGRALATTCREC